MTTVQMRKAELTLLLLSAGFFVLPFAVKALGHHELARNLFPFAAMAVPCMAGAGALRGARRRKQNSAPRVSAEPLKTTLSQGATNHGDRSNSRPDL